MDIELLLATAQRFELNGEHQNAFNVYNDAISNAIGTDRGRLLFECGQFLLRIGQLSSGVDALIECSRMDYFRNEIADILMDNYRANEEIFRNIYNSNLEKLSTYQYIKPISYPSFDELQVRFIPYITDKYVRLVTTENILTSNIQIIESEDNSVKEGDIFLASNFYNWKQIRKLIGLTRTDKMPVPWMLNPVYLYFSDQQEFIESLQIQCFYKMLEENRLVFIIGEDELHEFFSDCRVLMPKYFINAGQHSRCVEIIRERDNARNLHGNQLLSEVNEYYSVLGKKGIAERILAGSPRILFISSRFTTFLQYCIRDCKKACDELGLETLISIEDSDIQRTNAVSILENINTLKPDIIFQICHFRWEIKHIPEEIFYITWIQDMMQHIIQADSPGKLIDTDYMALATPGKKDIYTRLGYPEDRLLDAVIPASRFLYQKTELTTEEKERYASDISFVSNPGDPYKHIENILAGFSKYPDLIAGIKQGFEMIKNDITNFGELYTENGFAAVISDCLKANNAIGMVDVDRFAYNFWFLVGTRLFKSMPVEFLAKRGYSLKLWGSDWLEHPYLKKYAMGVAANGEELAKIYSSCKIQLQINGNSTSHARVYESTLCGSAVLVRYVPEEYDYADLRKVLREGVDFEFFRSQDDLLQKVDKLLEDAYKREQMNKNALEMTLQFGTYDAIMKKIMDGLKMYINNNEWSGPAELPDSGGEKDGE